jgi:hypothetical protein
VGGWVLRSLSVAFWGDGRVSESFLSEVFFLINAVAQWQQITSATQPTNLGHSGAVTCYAAQ